MKNLIDKELLKYMADNEIEIDVVFCLKCGQGFITIKDYKKRICSCPNCEHKHVIRFYKNGKVHIRNLESRDKDE